MWSNNGGQESDFLTYSRVLEPYHMALWTIQAIKTVLMKEIICAETDYYMSASSDEYFNELSQMSGFVVNAEYPS